MSIHRVYTRGHSSINAAGGVKFPGKSITKVYGSTILALWGVGGCQISRKKALHNTRMAPKYKCTLNTAPPTSPPTGLGLSCISASPVYPRSEVIRVAEISSHNLKQTNSKGEFHGNVEFSKKSKFYFSLIMQINVIHVVFTTWK